ncbi:DUF6192 family protein [Streptomyces tibetensis]|uniref:DUF6192 family protein n=1 Tax=Streptomyces tibetensis TaxID=2382123 RepID=UPI003F4D34DF
MENEAERFATIAKPPAGGTRWTVDEANRRVGRQVERLASRSGLDYGAGAVGWVHGSGGRREAFACRRCSRARSAT